MTARTYGPAYARTIARNGNPPTRPPHRPQGTDTAPQDQRR